MTSTKAKFKDITGAIEVFNNGTVMIHSTKGSIVSHIIKIVAIKVNESAVVVTIRDQDYPIHRSDFENGNDKKFEESVLDHYYYAMEPFVSVDE